MFIVGSTVQYDLVWSQDKNLPDWNSAQYTELEDVPSTTDQNSEGRNCNTRKDRDRRQNRHTCGIFIG